MIDGLRALRVAFEHLWLEKIKGFKHGQVARGYSYHKKKEAKLVAVVTKHK
jgi:hypothetical protein